ncbi:Transposase [Actinopolyspora xinjiangensis]|uniref:Transposase n=1 Tax=Actinopolyspora xinjiangensis TaxID=405564 RepID=A0A1H0X3M0_9ACTN|nr:Transposase [Actinopolyspora xinjiangensis]SDP95874.1 Transposase [Actinopolyspora xinjiangensis]SDP97282.1 Transposase [Actinopolyspora xinjiangensis]SDP97325.1 Transposase [Actinopolyspora xinjiangensis]
MQSRFYRWAAGGTWDRILTELQRAAEAASEVDWTVSVDSTVVRAHQHAAGAKGGHPQALGRSRGGLSTTIHLAVDGRGRPLSLLITPGQAGDAPQCLPLLAAIRVPRPGRGHPRTRPVRIIADKAYSSRAIRAHLRRRGLAATIPEPADQAGHRHRRGSAGGHPPAFEPTVYRQRNIVERSINRLKQWRGIATRFHTKAHYFHATLTLASILLWLRT